MWPRCGRGGLDVAEISRGARSSRGAGFRVLERLHGRGPSHFEGLAWHAPLLECRRRGRRAERRRGRWRGRRWRIGRADRDVAAVGASRGRRALFKTTLQDHTHRRRRSSPRHLFPRPTAPHSRRSSPRNHLPRPTIPHSTLKRREGRQAASAPTTASVSPRPGPLPNGAHRPCIGEGSECHRASSSAAAAEALSSHSTSGSRAHGAAHSASSSTLPPSDAGAKSDLLLLIDATALQATS